MAPSKQFPWGKPQPRGGALDALSLGGARKTLNWMEPAEKVSWTGPAEMKVSWAGPAETKVSRTGPAGALESRTGPAGALESWTL